jgi:hypothetical protein
MGDNQVQSHETNGTRHFDMDEAFCAVATSGYSIDAICAGSVSCSDSTPPRVIPTKNITASNTAIAPPFRGALSVRICLSESSWSCRSIRRPHLWFHRKRGKTSTVSLTSRNGTPGTPGSAYWGANPCSMVALAINSKRQSVNSTGAAESKGLSVGWRSPQNTYGGGNNPSTLPLTGTRRVKPPSPSPSITRRRTPAALAVGVHSF